VVVLFARIQVLLHISPGSLRIGWTAAVVECLKLVDVGSRLGSYHQLQQKQISKAESMQYKGLLMQRWA
jgi:hypothetical protein